MTNAEKYRKFRDELKYYEYAVHVISFDEATICPKNDKENSMEVSSFFVRKIIEITQSDEYYNVIKALVNDPEDLNEVDRKAVKFELVELDKKRKIPNELKFKEMEISDKASLAWQKAHDDLNYDEFETQLGKLIDVNKEIIKCLDGKYHGYDVLLNEMEDDFTEEKYDEFFDKLEREIAPLVKKILAMPKKYNTDIAKVKFPIDKQKELTKRICECMNYTDKNGYIGETLHPFTDCFNSNDVRTTTSYSEDLLFSNIFSVMHEVGHATYELQVDHKYDGTVLAGGTSCAIHESQSRFYENYLGRSRAFIKFLYPILKDTFPIELNGFTEDDIFYYVNDVTAQFTRTEADELTYPFHVLIRYKIEKELFSGKLDEKGISSRLNNLMNEYLGIIPNNKKEGCYQDMHWSSGFGYFPTYALGSAMSAQFYYSIIKDINIDACMEHGNFAPINRWLGEHVHQYGRSIKNMELIKLATNEEFNPNYYITYLKEKYSKIYNL